MSKDDLNRFLRHVSSDDADEVYQGLVLLPRLSRRDGSDVSEDVGLAERYLESSPLCVELFDVWDELIRGKTRPSKGHEGAFSAALLDAFATLIYSGSHDDALGSSKADVTKYDATRRSVVKRILKEKMGFINKFLSSTSDRKLLRALLKLLTGIAKQGSAPCRALAIKMNLMSLQLLKCATPFKSQQKRLREGSGVTGYGSVRHRYLQLIVALTCCADNDVKRKVLEPMGPAQVGFRFLSTDPPEVALRFLSCVENFILDDGSIRSSVKDTFFHPKHVLVHGIIPLYNEPTLRNASHSLLKRIILFKYGSKSSPNAQRLRGKAMKLLNFERGVVTLLRALSPVDDELQKEVACMLFDVSNANIATEYLKFSANRVICSPDISFKWIRSMNFLSVALKQLSINSEGEGIFRIVLGGNVHGVETKSLKLESISVSQWDDFGARILDVAFPPEKVLPKVSLSRNLLNSNSLIVVMNLNLIMQFLERVKRVIDLETSIASQNYSDDLVKSMLTHVQRLLMHRLPNVSTLSTLLSTRNASSKGDSDVENSRIIHGWTPQEAAWVTLHAARALVWYARVLPDCFRVASVDIAKSLTRLTAWKALNRPDFVKKVQAKVSILQLFQYISVQPLQLMEGPNLLSLLSVRSDVYRLKLNNHSQSYVIDEVDRALTTLLLSVLWFDEKNKADCLVSRQCLSALIGTVRNEKSAKRVADVLTKLFSNISTEPLFLRMMHSLDTDVEDTKTGGSLPLLVLVALELIHSLAMPDVILTPCVCKALAESDCGGALLAYAGVYLGINHSFLKQEMLKKSDSMLQSFGKALDIGSLSGLLIACLFPLPKLSLDCSQPRIFNEKLFEKHHNRMKETAFQSGASDSCRSARLLSRIIWSHFRSCRKEPSENYARDCHLPSDVVFCLDLLEVLVERHPDSVSESLVWVHPVEATKLVAPLFAIKRISAVFDTAAKSRSARISQGKTCSLNLDLYATGQNKMIVSLLQIWNTVHESCIDDVSIEAISDILLSSQHCLMEEISLDRIRLHDTDILRCADARISGKHCRSLSLLLFKLSNPTLAILRKLLLICGEAIDEEFDMTFSTLLRSALTDDSQYDSILGARLSIIKMLRQNDTFEALKLLWTTPTKWRIDAISVLMQIYEPFAFLVMSDILESRINKRSSYFEECLPLFEICIAPEGCLSERIGNLLFVSGLDLLGEAIAQVLKSKPDLSTSEAKIISLLMNRCPRVLSSKKASVAARLYIANLDSSLATLPIEHIALVQTIANVLRMGLPQIAIVRRVLHVLAERVERKLIADWLNCIRSAFASLGSNEIRSEESHRLLVDAVVESVRSCENLMQSPSILSVCMEISGIFGLLDNDPMAQAVFSHPSLAHGMVRAHDNSQVCLVLRLWIRALERGEEYLSLTKHLYPVLLAVYQGTLDEVDCLCRRLLAFFEKQNGEALPLSSFAFLKRVCALNGQGEEEPFVLLRECDADVSSLTLEAIHIVITKHYEWILQINFKGSLGTVFPLCRDLAVKSISPCSEACFARDLINKVDHDENPTKKRRLDNSLAADEQKNSYEELFDAETGANGDLSEKEDDSSQGFSSEESCRDHRETVEALGSTSEDCGQNMKWSSGALDPSFWLPCIRQFFILHALEARLPSDEQETDLSNTKATKIGSFPARSLVENGMVAYLVWCLSSFCSEVRLCAGECLQLYGQLAALETLFRERDQILLILRALRGAYTVDGGRSVELTQLPPIIASFVEQSLHVMLNPSHDLYKPINKFLLKRAWMDMDDVPLFYETFNSGGPNSKAERAWMMNVLHRGVRTYQDIKILNKRHVCDVMMSIFNAGDRGDIGTQEKVVDMLLKVAEVGSFGMRQLLRSGVVAWAFGALNICSRLCMDDVIETSMQEQDDRMIRMATRLLQILNSASKEFVGDAFNAEGCFVAEAILQVLPLVKHSVTAKNIQWKNMKERHSLIEMTLDTLILISLNEVIDISSRQLCDLLDVILLEDDSVQEKHQFLLLDLLVHSRCIGLFKVKEWTRLLTWSLELFILNRVSSIHVLVGFLRWMNMQAQSSVEFGSLIRSIDLDGLRLCTLPGNKTDFLKEWLTLDEQLVVKG